MQWTTKANLRLQLAVEQTKNAALAQEIERLNEYIVKCENLIDHERERVNDERDRADRINDSLLQQNGLPASTAVVRAEQAEEQKIQQEKFKEQAAIANEIFGETMDDFDVDSVQSLMEKVN